MTTITYSLPNTGYAPPSKDEARRLWHIVDAAYPDLGLIASVDEQEFRRAFSAVGLMYRRDTPDERHALTYFLDSANELISQHLKGSSVSGCALLGAVHAHCDIPWRKPDRSLGQLLEIGLDPYVGRRSENHWRGLLDGTRNLMQPTPPRSEFVQRAGQGQQKATFWRRGESGEARAIRPDEPLRSRR
jgi:hypothetical protein